MNLDAIVAPYTGTVNRRVLVSVQISDGYVTGADGIPTPNYLPAVQAYAQIQALTFRDIQQIAGLNLQGTRKAIYFSEGQVHGLVRPENKGGDLITFPDGSVWLVALVLEGWATAGWCKVAATLQDNS